MKKWIFTLFAFSLIASEELSYWDFHPFHVGGNFIGIGSANIEAPQGGHLDFHKGNVFTTLLVPISYKSYFFPRVELNAFTMNWNKNPKFNQKHFAFMQFALTFYSIAIDKWRWIARGDFNIDIQHFNKPGTYGLYSALLWGKHEIDPQWHYHIGALGYTGFEGQMVYPVIGLGYQPSERWLIQAVFPIEYSIEYNPDKNWRLSLKGRPLKERFRTGANEPQPRSVFCYSSIGAEFNVHYEQILRLEVELFAGYNFGGSFYIKDQFGNNALYMNVEGAPYLGASLNWGL